jgi:hypothetical protein
VGQHLGEIWGYVNDGYWTADNVSQAAKSQTVIKATNNGLWSPGDIKFKDIGGGPKGAPDGVINTGDNTRNNPGDRKVIGNASPRYSYGLNLSADWNNFFIGAFFQGVAKRDWWPGAEADAFWGQYNRPYNNIPKYQLGKIWSVDQPNAYFPRYHGYVAGGSGELNPPQTKYLQNVSYIRLKNIQVGYNLPAGLVQRAHLTAVRFYVSGENLWSYSPMYKLTKDIDPESIGGSDPILTNGTNGNTNNYPILKSMTIGLNVTL